MSEPGKPMTAFAASPIAYIIPALLLATVGLYYLYGALDQLGLDVQTVDAVVTGKQASPGGTTRWTDIAGGRAWAQSMPNPEVFALTLMVGGEPSVGLVSQTLFDAISPGERVRVRIKRTRLSGRLEVIEVLR